MDWLRDLLKSKNPVLVAGGVLIFLVFLLLLGTVGGVKAYRVIDNRYETQDAHKSDLDGIEKRIDAYIDNAAIRAAQEAAKAVEAAHHPKRAAKRLLKNDGGRDGLALDASEDADEVNALAGNRFEVPRGN